MNELFIRLKFVWQYAKHLDLYDIPSLELIFKFVNTLDKKDRKKHLKKFNKTYVSSKVYDAELPIRLKVKEENYPVGSFGYEFKKWSSSDDHIIDLFQLSLVPYRDTRKKNTKFNKFAEATMLQHDLIHFLNGYDISPMGEVCVLSFNLAKEWRKSYSTILFSSFLMSIRNTFLPSKYIKNKSLLIKLKYLPICVFLKLVIESYRRGKKSRWFLSVDWDWYLHQPLETVLENLNLQNKPVYWEKVNPFIKYDKTNKRN